MSKYNDMVDYYNHRIEELEKDNRFWRDRCRVIDQQQDSCIGRLEAYEAIINKYLFKQPTTTDSIFMFEGKCYRPVEFTLNRNEERCDTLTVDFVKMDVRLGE